MQSYHRTANLRSYDHGAQKIFETAFRKASNSLTQIRALEGILDHWLKLYRKVIPFRSGAGVTEGNFVQKLLAHISYWKSEYRLKRLENFLINNLPIEEGQVLNTFLIFINTYGTGLGLHNGGNRRGIEIVKTVWTANPKKLEEFRHMKGISGITGAISS